MENEDKQGQSLNMSRQNQGRSAVSFLAWTKTQIKKGKSEVYVTESLSQGEEQFEGETSQLSE